MDPKPMHDPKDSVSRHPVAAAVAVALAGATLLGGCASDGPVKPGEELTAARAAFAREDYARAARLLSEPAMKGDAEAQYALGYMYYYGQGVPRDLYRARSWLEHSANLGYADAKRALGLLSTYSRLPAASAAPVMEAPQPADAAAPAEVSATGSDTAAEAVAEAAAPVVTQDASAPAPAGEAAAPASVAAPAAAPVTEAVAPLAPAPVAELPAQSAPPAPAPVVPAAAPAEAAQVAPAAAPREVEQAPKIAAPAAPVPAPVVTAPVAPAAPAPASEIAPAAKPAPRAPAGADVMPESPAEAETTTAAVMPAVSPAITAERPRYTLHLLSSRNKGDLVRLAQTHGLSHAVSYYEVQQKDGTHYRLIFGGFATVAEANAALDALPDGLFKSRPFVNNYPQQLLVMHFDETTHQVARR